MPKLQKVTLFSKNGTCPWGPLQGPVLAALCQSATLTEFQHLVLYDSSQSSRNCFSDEHIIAVARALTTGTTTIMDSNNTTTNTTNNNHHHESLPMTATPSFRSSSSNLEELMISCWPLGRRGVEALCQMLGTNTSLQKLSMVVYELDEDNNTYETCTMPLLATALQSNATLRALEIHGSNEMGKWMQEAFWIALQSNYTLTRLQLCRHDDALFLKPFYEFYLKLNRAGRGMLLQHDNATQQQWIASISRVSNDLSCIFYFLSMNPLLCQCQCRQQQPV